MDMGWYWGRKKLKFEILVKQFENSLPGTQKRHYVSIKTISVQKYWLFVLRTKLRSTNRPQCDKKNVELS
jgi:hypothetical protein